MYNTPMKQKTSSLYIDNKDEITHFGVRYVKSSLNHNNTK